MKRRKKRENRGAFLCRLYSPLGKARFIECDRARMELMYDHAKYGHRWQTRKDGKRYFEHPRGVMVMIFDEFCIYDAILIMIAIGHDLIEDCARYTSAMKLEIIAGPEVARGILFVSKSRARKRTFLRDLLRHGTWRELFVKCCDRLHNMRDLPRGNGKAAVGFRLKQTIETRDFYLELTARLVEISPAAHREACIILADKLKAIVRKHARSLGISPEPRAAP